MENGTKITNLYGSKFSLQEVDNFTERYISQKGKPLEYKELDFLRGAIKNKSAIILDVGANVGIYSVLLAEATKEATCVYSFEPNPDMRKRLQKNIDLNGLSCVEIVPYAIGAEEKEAQLFIPLKNKGEASLTKVNSDFETQPVQVRTLSSFNINLSAYDVSILKVDVEGHELDVLVPYLRTAEVSQRPTFIQFETRHLSSEHLCEIQSLLAQAGYKLVLKNSLNSIYKLPQKTLFSCQRNEGVYLLEWIAYHKAIGFDRIVVFSNDCDDGSDLLLDQLNEIGLIEHHTFSSNGLAPQFVAARKAIEGKIFEEGEWVCWLDTDEYLNIHKGSGKVCDLIESLGNAEGIVLNWRLFGAGSDSNKWPGSQLHEHYRYASKLDAPRNRQVKTLFRFSDMIKSLDPHRPELELKFREKNKYFVDAGLAPTPEEFYFGRRSSGTLQHQLPYVAREPIAQINHYIVRNRELYKLKIARGRGYRGKSSKVRHTEKFFDRLNVNDVEDTSILRHNAEKTTILAKLLEQRAISELNKKCIDFAFEQSDRYSIDQAAEFKKVITRQTQIAVKRFRAALDIAVAHNCPLCGYFGQFSPMGVPLRPSARCPKCRSLERHRLLKIVMDREEIFSSHDALLHFAPEPQLQKIISNKVGIYHTADLYASNVTHHLDIENIDLPNQSYDKVICSHVLEHVDDIRALAEIKRILKPGGLALLAVPIVDGWDKTYENSGITSPKDRTIHFGQKDHVRMYGNDFRDRIQNTGFELREVVAVEPDVLKFGLLRGERLFIASKPAQ